MNQALTKMAEYRECDKERLLAKLVRDFNSNPDQDYMFFVCLGHKPAIISLAKEQGLISFDQFPVLEGCKLQNLDRAKKDNYFLFTGDKRSILGCANTLREAGIGVHAKPNGKEGYKLIAPIWLRGSYSQTDFD